MPLSSSFERSIIHDALCSLYAHRSFIDPEEIIEGEKTVAAIMSHPLFLHYLCILPTDTPQLRKSNGYSAQILRDVEIENDNVHFRHFQAALIAIEKMPRG